MRAEPPDYFEPETGAVLTTLLIVRDVDRSREFYERVLGATVIREREPGVLRFQNSYIVLNTEGGPTDDKPDVQAQAPPDANTLSDEHTGSRRPRDLRGVALPRRRVPDPAQGPPDGDPLLPARPRGLLDRGRPGHGHTGGDGPHSSIVRVPNWRSEPLAESAG